MKRWLLSTLVAAALMVTGCASSGLKGKPASDSSQIDELNLVALPMPVNLRAGPGAADGVVVKVYAINRRRPKAQPIREGTLELLMYDGLAHAGAMGTNRLVHAWTFPASELAPHAFVATVGTGYLFSLAWGNTPPQANQITVVARLMAPQKPAVSSAPNFIALAPEGGKVDR